MENTHPGLGYLSNQGQQAARRRTRGRPPRHLTGLGKLYCSVGRGLVETIFRDVSAYIQYFPCAILFIVIEEQSIRPSDSADHNQSVYGYNVYSIHHTSVSEPRENNRIPWFLGEIHKQTQPRIDVLAAVVFVQDMVRFRKPYATIKSRRFSFP